MLSLLRFALTNWCAAPGWPLGWPGCSVEDTMVMREKSPFMPWATVPGTLGEMATIWKASAGERDMREGGTAPAAS